MTIRILVSSWRYPRLASMPASIYILLALFALFIFLCGAGHMLRYLNLADTQLFANVNTCTACISLATALYLLPLVPSLLGQWDKSLTDLIHLNEEAIESRKKLFTFMAFLCHEIRNPLFAITSSVTSLEDMDLTEEQSIALGSIMDSSSLMLRLVNDVLDLSKIDAGKLQLESKVFDLHRMMNNLDHTVGMQVASKHHNDDDDDTVQFHINMDTNVPRMISSDPVRLLQIVYNLISNALKFTHHGSIDVDIHVCTKVEAIRAGVFASHGTVQDDTGHHPDYSRSHQNMSADDDNVNTFSMALLDAAEQGTADGPDHKTLDTTTVFLRISVTDTGIGIDEDRLSTIFEPYAQAKLSDYRKFGGTGLGLSIIKGLATAMGGTISATSAVGKGSSFIVHLPVQTIPEQLQSRDLQLIDTKFGSEIKPSTNTLMGRSSLRPNANTVNCAFNGLGTNSRSRSTHRGASRPNDIGSSESDAFKLLGALDSIMTTSHPSESMSANGTGKAYTRKKAPPLKPLSLPTNEHVVLIVDDNQVNQKILGRMLDHFKVEHRTAGNGQEAVDAFVQASRNLNQSRDDLPHFKLVFMDLSMPVMDGYDAIAELRRLGVTIPIVALTANALQQERDRAATAGATDFQTKPILRQDLHQVCSTYLLQ